MSLASGLRPKPCRKTEGSSTSSDTFTVDGRVSCSFFHRRRLLMSVQQINFVECCWSRLEVQRYVQVRQVQLIIRTVDLGTNGLQIWPTRQQTRVPGTTRAKKWFDVPLDLHGAV